MCNVHYIPVLPPPLIFNIKVNVSYMTQNGLNHISNMLLKSVRKTDLDHSQV